MANDNNDVGPAVPSAGEVDCAKPVQGPRGRGVARSRSSGAAGLRAVDPRGRCAPAECKDRLGRRAVSLTDGERHLATQVRLASARKCEPTILVVSLH